MGKGEWAKGKESALWLSRFESWPRSRGFGSPPLRLCLCSCLCGFYAPQPGSARRLTSVFNHIPDLSLIGVVVGKIVFLFELGIVIVRLSFRPRQLGDAGHRWPDAVGLYPFGQAKELKFLDRAIGSQQSLICVCAALVRRYNQQIQVVPQVAKQGQILPNE